MSEAGVEESDRLITDEMVDEFKHQYLAGQALAEEEGLNAPRAVYNEEENEIIQQGAEDDNEEIYSIKEAPDEILEKIDKEDFDEMMSTFVFMGNNDSHEENTHVDEEGNLIALDFDRSGKEASDEFDLKVKQGSNARTGMTIGKSNDEFSENMYAHEEDILETAGERAKELIENDEVDELLEPVEEVDEHLDSSHDDLAPRMRNNINLAAEYYENNFEGDEE